MLIALDSVGFQLLKRTGDALSTVYSVEGMQVATAKLHLSGGAIGSEICARTCPVDDVLQ